MLTRFCRTFALAVASFLLALPAAAQTSGTLRGTVKDPSDAVVPNAKVTATQQATKVTRSANTDAAGSFVFPVLPVGAYDLEVEATGFKKYQQKEINIDIGRVVLVEAKLTVGTAGEVVEVGAAPPLVETTNTQLGAVVNERAVTNLPLSARDTYQLLQLQPGVQSNVGQDLFFGTEAAGVVSVNGGRGRSNNFNVNGGDANDTFANLPVIQPSPDTIQEFRVITNNFDAEYGRNSGSVVNVVTKSGTNDFHGNLFEFFRNEKLNAAGFFDVERPVFKQNVFGATLGGPIIKDSTYFFVSYEGKRLRRGVSSDVVTVPTPDEALGDFSQPNPATGLVPLPFGGAMGEDNVGVILFNRCGVNDMGNPFPGGTAWSTIFPGNMIPPTCFDPTAADLRVQFVPTDPSGEFQAVPVGREDGTQFTVRLDHKLTDKHQLGIYYFFSDNFLTKPFARFQAGGAVLPGFGDLSDQRFQQANITHTWVISSTTVNELRFNYFRAGQETFFHPQRTHLLTDSCTPAVVDCFTGTDPVTMQPIGITPGLDPDREGVPFIDVAGAFSIGSNFEGELPAAGNSFQWSDNFSKVVGKHSLKFGGDVRRQRYDQFLFFDVNGSYSYFGGGPNDIGLLHPDPEDPMNLNDTATQSLIPNYLLGLPDFYLQGAAQEERVRSTSLYLFAQDSWKIKDNLTLNYGLRWEFNTPIGDVGQKVQTFRENQVGTIYPCQLSAASQAALGFPDGNCNPGGSAEAVFPLGLVVPGDAGISNALTQTYYRAFAPRIGLAWSPGATDGWFAKLTGGPGRTSIRMGWGMFYNPVEQLVLEQFSAEPPFGGSSGLSNVMFNTPFQFQDGSSAPNPFGGILNPERGQPVDWSRFRPILLFGQFLPNLRPQYAAQYNFTVQRQITDSLMFQVGYVGSQGHRLLTTHDLNFGNPQTCLDLQAASDFYLPTAPPDPPNPNADQALSDLFACGAFFADVPYTIPANALPAGFTLTLPYGNVPSVTGPNATDITLVGLRQFSSPQCEPTALPDPNTGVAAGCPPDGVPVFSNIFAQDTIAHSSYNSLQVLLEKRFSKGLQFTAAYTWSKSIDNASSFENILNPFDFEASRSLSLFHAAHRAVFSYYWELPVPKYDGFKGKLLNGWAISGITTFQTGFPIRILSEDDQELMLSFDFELPGRPDQIGPFTTMDPRSSPGSLFFDPGAFTTAAFGTLGTAPRTICCGPSINNWDFGIHKDTPLNERMRLEFRAEFFNMWNRTQFFNPDGNITNGSEFGTVKRAKDPRQIQFALKLFF
ncbi:MAG: carboxypeptidase regulatory-like domain-containing protein [Terriglobales bacterium]